MTPKVFFADLTHCGTVANADTFPLGLGCVSAYAKKEFGKEIDLEIFKFPDDLNQALRRERPDVLCLSNYSWNANLSNAFARYVREAYPDCTIVMGGPNISIARDGRQSFLKSHPAIDLYVKFEGEQAFVEVMHALMDHGLDWRRVSKEHKAFTNTLYLDRRDDAYIEGIEQRITDYMSVPSPYLTGLMDKFFVQGLRPLVEFTRGCPYSCTFCTDSHSHRSKIFRKSADFVRDELEYIAQHMKAPSDLIFADLNFGMFQEDIEFAKITSDIISRYNWPRTITTSPGKSHPERVLQAAKIINGDKRGVIKFAASLQSTDDDVLSAISRRNLPLDKIEPVTRGAGKAGDYTEYFSEIILALPGDTPKKHYQSLKDAIDRLRMNVVNVHQLTILDGTPMALPEHKELYGLQSMYRVFVGCLGTYEIGESKVSVGEIEEVVIANKGMTHEEWLVCRVMSLLVKIYIDRDYFFEIFGLMRRLGLSPIELLEHLRVNFIHRHPKFQSVIDLFLKKTVEPLHKSYDELMTFISSPETVAKFESGELGGNELLIHRAMAYLECGDELHAALSEAAVSYIGEHHPVDETMRRYIEQAVRFSRLRKFDPTNYMDDVEAFFDFDFVAAAEQGFQVLPEDVIADRRKVRFYFNDIARSEIDYAIRTWVMREGSRRENQPRSSSSSGTKVQFDESANTKFSFGKLFHYSNLRVMNRSAEYIG